MGKGLGARHWRSETIPSPCFLWLSAQPLLAGDTASRRFRIALRVQAQSLSPTSSLLRKGMGGPRQRQPHTANRSRATVHQTAIHLKVKEIIFRERVAEGRSGCLGEPTVSRRQKLSLKLPHPY